LVAVHVAGRATYERGRYELAERRDENEEEGGDDPGQRERQSHSAESLQAAGPEVARRLEQALIEAFERDEDRQRHEWEPDVAEHQHDREPAVEELGKRVIGGPNPGPEEERVDNALAAENHLPGEHPQEIARQKRCDQQEQENVLPLCPRQRQVIRERVPLG